MSSEVPKRALIRPSLPPLAWLVVALWSGIAAAEAVTWHAGRGGLGRVTWLYAVGCAALALLGGFLARTRWTSWALVALGLSAGLALGGLYWSHWNSEVGQLERAGSKTWLVEVLTDDAPGRFGSSSRGRIIGPVCAGALITVDWPTADDKTFPALGRQVEVLGSVKASGVDEWGRRSFRTGVVGNLSARRVRETGWARSMRGAVGPLRQWAVGRVATVAGPGGDLLSGVLLGDRRRMTGTPAETDFRTTGLTHLVAVSGSHLVVVAAVAGWLLAALGLGRWQRSVGIAAVVGAYVVFSGVQPSAVRAWVMAMAAAAAWVGGRRADGGSTLAVAAAAVLVVSPISSFDLGFRLSVAAVAGLVLLARLGTAWIEPSLPRVLRGVAEPVSLTLAATVATLPITVPTFQMLSLVSPVANILCGPLVSVVLLAGLAGLVAGAVWPALGAFVLGLAGATGAFAVTIAGWLASWPHAAIPLGFSAVGGFTLAVGAIAAVWVAWPTPTRGRSIGLVGALVAGTLLLSIGPHVSTGPTIEVLDVGQGDAILVRDAGHALLVDTGPSPAVLRSALARAGVRALDGVVITHMHADHAGGLAALEGLVKVGFVGLPAGARAKPSQILSTAESLCGPEGVRDVTAGDAFTAGGIVLSAVSPAAPVEDASANESSVVLLASTAGFSAVLTGDAESVVLQPLIDQGVLGDIDVLKVGHHGSDEAVSDSVLAALKPEYALISVGTGNKFGHPKASTLEELARAGSRVVRTDQSGDITVQIGERGYAVRAARATARRGGPRVAARALRRCGSAAAAYATLVFDPTNLASRTLDTVSEPHGQATLGVQARLPHHRRAGPAAEPSGRFTQGERCRGGRPGLQPGDLRGGVDQRRRRGGGVQYAAVRLRAPPGDRARNRQALQRRRRDPRALCRGSVTHDHTGVGRQEAREEHAALQGRRQARRCDRAQDA